ncbi:hypothetical protein ACQ4M3_08870 [Leptolyngbya sp. AN03gr2]|uniref:hypothetical protein n=1 Tax=unclassified Leptolyngbya TaxID=2650499 RepID=UPI003D3120EC
MPRGLRAIADQDVIVTKAGASFGIGGGARIQPGRSFHPNPYPSGLNPSSARPANNIQPFRPNPNSLSNRPSSVNNGNPPGNSPVNPPTSNPLPGNPTTNRPPVVTPPSSNTPPRPANPTSPTQNPTVPNPKNPASPKPVPPGTSVPSGLLPPFRNPASPGGGNGGGSGNGATFNFPPVERAYQFNIQLGATAFVRATGQPFIGNGSNGRVVTGSFSGLGVPVSLRRYSVPISDGIRYFHELTFIDIAGATIKNVSQSVDDNTGFSDRGDPLGFVHRDWTIRIDNNDPKPVDPQAATPGFNPPSVPPGWNPPQIANPASPTANPSTPSNPLTNSPANPFRGPTNNPSPVLSPSGNPNANPLRNPTGSPSNSPSTNPNSNPNPNQVRNPWQRVGLNPLSNREAFSNPTSSPSNANQNRLTPSNANQNRVNPNPTQNLNPNSNLNPNGSPTQQFREQLEKQFKEEPKIDPTQQSCRNQCMADLGNQQKGNNEMVAVQVNRFLLWNRLIGRPQYVPETIMVPRGMEQFARMMGNRTADIRSRFGLAELRARLAQMMNIINTAATLHNAAMLSTNLAQTLGDLVTQSFQTFGPMFGVDQSVAETFDANEVLGKAFNETMEKAIGKDAWNGTKTAWLKLNRIVTTASNIVWTVRSMGDSAREIAEWTAENTGKIGNALKRFRVVGENAYSWMPERVTAQNRWQQRIQRLMEGTENIDDAASSLTGVVGEVRSITEELNELKEQKQSFDKAVKEATPNNRPDNDATKKAADQSDQASKSPTLQPADREKGDAE